MIGRGPAGDARGGLAVRGRRTGGPPGRGLFTGGAGIFIFGGDKFLFGGGSRAFLFGGGGSAFLLGGGAGTLAQVAFEGSGNVSPCLIVNLWSLSLTLIAENRTPPVVFPPSVFVAPEKTYLGPFSGAEPGKPLTSITVIRND